MHKTMIAMIAVIATMTMPTVEAATPRTPATVVIAIINPPIPVMIDPMIATIGPTTATIPAICTIMFCCAGDSASHFSRRDCVTSATLSRTGCNNCPMVAPNSAPVSFNWLRVVCHWSIGSRVSSKVFATLSVESSAMSANSSKLIEPSLTAWKTLSPCLPNNSYAAARPSVSSSPLAIVLCNSESA